MFVQYLKGMLVLKLLEKSGHHVMCSMCFTEVSRVQIQGIQHLHLMQSRMGG